MFIRAAAAIFIVIIFAPWYPAQADAQSIELSGGYYQWGKLTREVTHHVRFGQSGGFDLFYALTIELRERGRWTPYISLLLAPTQQNHWPKDTEATPFWIQEGFNPHPGGRFSSYRPQGERDAFLWSTLTGGVGYEFMSNNRVNPSLLMGLGLASISQAEHKSWGAAPMHSVMAELRPRLHLKALDDLAMGINCGVQFVFTRIGESFTLLPDAAGNDPANFPYRTIIPLFCGMSANVRLGAAK